MNKIKNKLLPTIVNVIVALFYIVASIIGLSIGIQMLNWIIGW